ncbi:MAG: DUF559 domain-containing protein [Armatimonadetes bacterium]|nr:DUF559 domain-containing protein [Armatimonadota bacterium]
MREKERNLNPENIERVRKLRSEMSESEKLLWRYLSDKSIGFKFRRQHPLGPYALDFYCPKLRLCIEVDGEQHSLTRSRDRRRDEFLLEKGILTIRIPSLELFDESGVGVHEWVSRLRIICDSRALQRGQELADHW